LLKLLELSLRTTPFFGSGARDGFFGETEVRFVVSIFFSIEIFVGDFSSS